jgi:hypothetical protein
VAEFVPIGSMMGMADLNQQLGALGLQQFGQNRKLLAVEVERLMNG